MKLQVGSGESLQLQDHVNLEGIARVVREKYGWNAFTLVYRDEENEWITIGSEAELLAAKQTVAPAPLEIRVLAKTSSGNDENDELVEVNLGTSNNNNNSEIMPVTTTNAAAAAVSHGESDVGESDFEFVEGEEDYITNLTTSAAAAHPNGLPSEATYSIPSQGSVELFHEELQPLAAIVSQQLLDQENPYATSHCAPMQPPTFTAEPSPPTPAPVVDAEIADLLLPSEAPVVELPPPQTPAATPSQNAEASEAPKQSEPVLREDVVTEIAEQVIREAAAQHFSLLAENLEKILQQADETVPPLCEALARVFAKPETGRNVQVALQDPAIVSALVALSEEYLARQEQGNFWQALSPLVLQLLNLLTKLVTQSPELFSLIPSASATAVRHVAALKACAAGGEASAVAPTTSATTAASGSCETNEDMEVVHKRVQCNGCLELDPKLTDYVRGPRFKSAVVEDFDLCLKCEQSGKYRDSHGPFLKIYKPSQAPEAILCVLPAAHRGNGTTPAQEQAPQRVLEQFWDEVKGSDAVKGNNTFVSAEDVPRCAALDPEVMKGLVEAHAEGAAAAASASGIPAPPVVSSVEAAVLNVTSTNGCPGRHMLRRFVVPRHGYVCDRCSVIAGDFAVMHGCRICNFDLCDACLNGKSEGGVAAAFAATTPAITEVSAKPQAKFVTDVSLPDGSVVAPSASLSKTWRLRNNGNVRWPQGSRIVHVGGDSIGLPAGGVLVDAVEPGHVVDLTVPLIAPARPGRVVGYFRLMTPDQKRFGNRFWVDLTVDGTIGQQLAATVAAPFFEMGKSIVSRVQEVLVPGLPVTAASASTTPVEVVPPPSTTPATPSYPKVEPPPVDPRLETYAIELTTLSEMGFLDFEKNCDYLSDANGDLETVITRLMADAAAP